MRKLTRIMLVRRLIDTNLQTENIPPLTLQEKAILLILEIAEMKGISYTIEGFNNVLSALDLDNFNDDRLEELKEVYAKEERQLLFEDLFGGQVKRVDVVSGS